MYDVKREKKGKVATAACFHAPPKGREEREGERGSALLKAKRRREKPY